jgi:hypothetical protein
MHDGTRNSACSLPLVFANMVLLIVAAAREGKLDGAPTCQYNLTVLAISFAVLSLLWTLANICAVCCYLMIAECVTIVNCLCCWVLFFVAALAAFGAAGLVVTHSASCASYDGSFLWVMIVVDGSLAAALTGIAILRFAGPFCLSIISDSVSGRDSGGDLAVV